jgi:beta-glucanase (GH16 family)
LFTILVLRRTPRFPELKVAAVQGSRRRRFIALLSIVVAMVAIPGIANAMAPLPPPLVAGAPRPPVGPPLPPGTRAQAPVGMAAAGAARSTMASQPAPTCGGEKIAKASGGNWTCTFDDEFNGSALDTTKWAVQQTSTSGFQSGGECFVNSKNNVSVSGGMLDLTVRKEAAPFTCADPYGNYATQYTSGSVSTYDLFSQTYGRFEVRAKLPAASIRGLQESFWLWPVDATKYGSWPASGEIDFAEFYSEYADRAIPYIHYYPTTASAAVTNNNCMISDISQFHTYAVEWTSSSIKIIYDGQTCLTDALAPGSAPFNQPFIIALTQALGSGTNALDPASTPLPATTQVDYVRAWR